jgi:hypothetical protein
MMRWPRFLTYGSWGCTGLSTTTTTAAAELAAIIDERV